MGLTGLYARLRPRVRIYPAEHSTVRLDRGRGHWRWTVIDNRTGEAMMTSIAVSKGIALRQAETWQRLFARRNGRPPEIL